MSARRTLAEMLGEVASGTLDTLAGAAGIDVREIALTLPVELAVRHTEAGPQLLGDLPRRVTRTAFDIEPGRLHVRWVKEVA
jgi:hypothetical protein